MNNYKIHHNVIIACDQFGTIGNKGELPWDKLEGDLARFKELTTGHVVIMGRLTWESLPMFPKGFSNRLNMVLTRNCDRIVNGSLLPNCQPLDNSIQLVDGFSNLLFKLQDIANSKQSDLQVFHIGGKHLIEGIIESGVVERIHLTLVHKPHSGDVKIEILPMLLLDVLHNAKSQYEILGKPEVFKDNTYYTLIRK